jgi:hypothetical protein
MAHEQGIKTPAGAGEPDFDLSFAGMPPPRLVMNG